MESGVSMSISQNKYSFEDIIGLLSEYGLEYHPLGGQKYMAQLGEKKTKDTTIRWQKRRVLCYVTDEDYNAVVTELHEDDRLVKLDFAEKEQKAARIEIENGEQKWSNKIVAVFYGNKSLNPAQAPDYQPHCIYVYGNEVLDTLVRILARRRMKMGMTKIDAVWYGAAVLTYDACQKKLNWNLNDVLFSQKVIDTAAKDILGETIPPALVSQHAVANSNSSDVGCAYLVDGPEKTRRISYLEEFADKRTSPNLSEMKDNIVLEAGQGKVTIRELSDFVKDVYTPRMKELLGNNSLENGSEDEKLTGKKKDFDHNIILYGPPGTGKTYNSVNYAVAICEGKTFEEVEEENYEDVLDRFDDLKTKGRIAFTTFHQSYGYEEFIEGIKPVMDDDSADIGYRIEPGVFKKFCRDNSRSLVANKDSAYYVKENPRIWGMLLGGTGTSKTKRECFEQGVIRLGCSDIKDEEILTDDGDSQNRNGHFRMVYDFINTVEIGDIVFSAKTLKSIDAIGVVTGDYVFNENSIDYQRERSVKWFATDLDQDITDFLPQKRKQMARFSLFNGDEIGIDAISGILENNGIENIFSLHRENKPCVFIIDEINRGNISKIFGELITLIEDTKRAGQPEAASAILPYSGEEFSVPANVYILGTMNTADRSIQLMDTALRRRFKFREMMPDTDILRSLDIQKIEAGGTTIDIPMMLEAMNDRIAFLFDREHTIGHAFFTGLKKDSSLERLASIFEKAIIPLLQEYFYEDYQKIQLVLGDNAKADDRDKFIVDEQVKLNDLFMGNVEDIIDEKEVTYRINRDAFMNINAYKTIAKNL